MVIKTLQSNGEKAKKLILAAVPLIAQEDWTETLQQNRVCIVMSLLLFLAFSVTIVRISCTMGY